MPNEAQPVTTRPNPAQDIGSVAVNAVMSPDVLVVCPPPFGEHELAPAFREVCDQLGCELLDLDGVATYSDLDDTHLEEAGHIAVAAAVEECIRKMLV